MAGKVHFFFSSNVAKHVFVQKVLRPGKEIGGSALPQLGISLARKLGSPKCFFRF
jgi:hypothetical protein